MVKQVVLRDTTLVYNLLDMSALKFTKLAGQTTLPPHQTVPVAPPQRYRKSTGNGGWDE